MTSKYILFAFFELLRKVIENVKELKTKETTLEK
jgi:hypothetical protein